MLYQNILDKIVESSKQVFKSNLTGVYLHGSMAMGCFNPDKSDIDIIIVVEENISDEQKMYFMKGIVELNKFAPSKGIELSIVKKTYCRKFLYPTPFELHFSSTHLQWFLENPEDYVSKMKGTDKDLALENPIYIILNLCRVAAYLRDGLITSKVQGENGE